MKTMLGAASAECQRAAASGHPPHAVTVDRRDDQNWQKPGQKQHPPALRLHPAIDAHVLLLHFIDESSVINSRQAAGRNRLRFVRILNSGFKLTHVFEIADLHFGNVAGTNLVNELIVGKVGRGIPNENGLKHNEQTEDSEEVKNRKEPSTFGLAFHWMIDGKRIFLHGLAATTVPNFGKRESLAPITGMRPRQQDKPYDFFERRR